LNNNLCPLCESKSDLFYQKSKVFHLCRNCKGVYLNTSFYLNSEREKIRYELHQNNLDDEGFQEFVRPITNSILEDYSKENNGLDFGAGTGSAVSKILLENEYNIKKYDPFFYDLPELLTEKYDYIACCEVVEHFHHPKKEFKLLSKLLKKNSKLYIMTNLFDSNINFEKWWYKNDPTHVFLYQKSTFEYIKETFKFNDCKITDNLIVLEK